MFTFAKQWKNGKKNYTLKTKQYSEYNIIYFTCLAEVNNLIFESFK